MIYLVVMNPMDAEQRPITAFSNKEQAEDFTRSYGGDIEEIPFNPDFPPPPKDLTKFRVSINWAGDVWVTRNFDIYKFKDTTNVETDKVQLWQQPYKRWVAHVWARNEEKAIEIGKEYYSKLESGEMHFYVV